MSYLARPGSILAGWRIRNSLTAKGSSIAAKSYGQFSGARPPSRRTPPGGKRGKWQVKHAPVRNN